MGWGALVHCVPADGEELRNHRIWASGATFTQRVQASALRLERPHAELLVTCSLQTLQLADCVKEKNKDCVSRRLSRPTPLSTTTTMGSLWRSDTNPTSHGGGTAPSSCLLRGREKPLRGFPDSTVSCSTQSQEGEAPAQLEGYPKRLSYKSWPKSRVGGRGEFQGSRVGENFLTHLSGLLRSQADAAHMAPATPSGASLCAEV